MFYNHSISVPIRHNVFVKATFKSTTPQDINDPCRDVHLAKGKLQLHCVEINPTKVASKGIKVDEYKLYGRSFTEASEAVRARYSVMNGLTVQHQTNISARQVNTANNFISIQQVMHENYAFMAHQEACKSYRAMVLLFDKVSDWLAHSARKEDANKFPWLYFDFQEDAETSRVAMADFYDTDLYTANELVNALAQRHHTRVGICNRVNRMELLQNDTGPTPPTATENHPSVSDNDASQHASPPANPALIALSSPSTSPTPTTPETDTVVHPLSLPKTSPASLPEQAQPRKDVPTETPSMDTPSYSEISALEDLRAARAEHAFVPSISQPTLQPTPATQQTSKLVNVRGMTIKHKPHTVTDNTEGGYIDKLISRKSRKPSKAGTPYRADRGGSTHVNPRRRPKGGEIVIHPPVTIPPSTAGENSVSRPNDAKD